MAYAQTNNQITLSGDLANNPTAQDILDKIEKSKRWIKQIQERNFEASEKQRDLEEKRAEVLQYLQDDLEKWDEVWSYYTFDKMLERALVNHPANSTDTIYDHPLKFTASKINAGRAALALAVENGSGSEEARNAFVNAAKITRAEMISANALYNVLSGNAYYNQQTLFESDGQFESLSGESLRKYYQDYRTNPEYLKANPFDKISWEELGKNNPNTECRDGYVLVYRTTSDDYVCTTEYTAEMWIRHNMGRIVDEGSSQVQAVDIEKLEHDRIAEKVNTLNSKVYSIQEYYEKKISETVLKYDSLFVDIQNEKIKQEKAVLERLNSGDISNDMASEEIIFVRENYVVLKENIETEKSQILELFEAQQSSDIESFVQNYEHDFGIEFVWNSDTNAFVIS
ncbi:hypothetical protein [Nitrosopumilus sp.]|uniref:hypothetical protein n=1 Tax=Nitrosopumilus sp. TaxID=2024843 RepID=UPI00349FF44A